jgi:RimJ/RimL family protein N-acetyltransferase
MSTISPDPKETPLTIEERLAPDGELRRVPDITLETLARAFFREGAKYGFGRVDYIRYATLLLDQVLKNRRGDQPGNPSGWYASIEMPDPGFTTITLPESPHLPLRGPRVMVRAMDPARDVPLFERWVAEADGRYFLLSRTTAQQQPIGDLVTSPTSVVGIITLPDGTPIGAVAFLDLDPDQRKAELRKIIGDPVHRGSGYAREASKLWIHYGVVHLGLKKVYLNTLETDIRNVRMDEELGFRVEGILRNEVLIDGKYHDVLRMGLWQPGM